MQQDIVLVNMPWAEFYRPSLQLGLIQALLARDGIDSHGYYAMLRYAERVKAQTYSATEDLYRPYCEWVFTRAAFDQQSREEEAFFAHLDANRTPRDQTRLLRALRAAVPAFLDQCVDEVLGMRPRIVGFATSMMQTLPSVALARRLKEADPAIRILFGGAHCNGHMGAALMEAFRDIDVVVKDQCDAWVGEFFGRLLEDGDLSGFAGICWRGPDGIRDNAPAPRFDDLDNNPVPDFSDYFDQLRRSPLNGVMDPSVPFEGSRGCWFGERSQCGFCGVNGSTLKFRQRNPERLVEELRTQRQRHGVGIFIASDEITPTRFPDELPALLSERLPSASIFYEMRPSTPRRQLANLASACHFGTQPGVEHLSTSVLTKMNKRLKGINNVALLRRARELGINLWWNLLYGVPGERREDYLELLPSLPLLHHLQPPFVFPITLARYSPYYDRPREHGIRILGPQSGLEYAYPLNDALRERLAFNFDFEHLSGYEPGEVAQMLTEVVGYWWSEHETAALDAHLCADDVQIEDRRCGSRSIRLGPHAGRLYRCLESPGTLSQIAARMRKFSSGAYLGIRGERGIARTLEALTEDGLIWTGDQRWVALAVPRTSDFWLNGP